MSNNGSPKTEIVRASEMGEKVVRRIRDIRFPDVVSDHRRELAKYKRRLGKRKEVQYTTPGMLDPTGKGGKRTGFIVEVYGQQIAVERPADPGPGVAYGYSGYDRFMGISSHATQFGLLADPEFNRDIRPQRVDEYQSAMQAGRWRDLLSDPISITENGHVLNGQHRIAAAVRVDWEKAGNDPAFLVVWNVDPQEALHADGSRRTVRDEKIIATKLVDAS